jgi:hypothetical protein
LTALPRPSNILDATSNGLSAFLVPLNSWQLNLPGRLCEPQIDYGHLGEGPTLECLFLKRFHASVFLGAQLDGVEELGEYRREALWAAGSAAEAYFLPRGKAIGVRDKSSCTMMASAFAIQAERSARLDLAP